MIDIIVGIVGIFLGLCFVAILILFLAVFCKNAFTILGLKTVDTRNVIDGRHPGFNWILSEDKLPKVEGHYLTARKTYGKWLVEQRYFWLDIEGSTHWSYYEVANDIKEVTAWAEMPTYEK